MTQNTAPPAPDEKTLQATRAKVRELLDRTEAFGQLAPEERREIARNMVEIGSYMANPDGVLSQEQSGDVPLAQPLRGTDTAVKNTAARAGGDQGFAGEDFEGGAIRQGTEQFGELVGHVDFAAFVGGLIENVFQAIVTSSIDQMRAYSEMLKSVSQSVSDFARDNITENNARDWLVESYPDVFGLSTGGGGGGFGFGDEGGGSPRLTVSGDSAETRLKTVSQDLELAKPITDISDAESEAALVRGARMAMAKSRMQLLASMVMMGISRIVVTDGQIKAKVVFGMRASDVAARQSKASAYDRKTSRSGSAFGGGALIGGLFGFGGGASKSNSHVTTVGSSLDERSTSQAAVKAQLSGDVRVNFKSDFLPMSSLASPEMIAAIQGNATPTTPAAHNQGSDTSGSGGS
ncbi:hypothetical protein EI983_14075 [Roseovarius faecimaris]|uniref:Uncharacterized protein n=1 Tax=Roseovarius faecimaris TaxID=2494550 RepID=A0A6I6IV89_9RHOB|nr:hypothetical protein [Roseovarius faecimaris]QGX99326.1 hypothetical protein EI983_14075 [Roseovarius faecimaris]